MRLDKKLKNYSKTDFYPFHMPGHKRQSMDFPSPEEIDITEIDGFDNLHHATGILKEAQQRAAALYGSMDSYFLVNGSTVGILASVYAALPRGGHLLMARNCHKAAYHAAELTQAQTHYLYPMSTDVGIQGSIDPADVRRAFEKNPAIRVVLLTSPTYDGVISDIRQIADIAHAHGAILIVDEAHGAHFGFGHGFPEKATRLGADLVIESLHKTLPAFTQTAILHRCSDRVSDEALRRSLGIFQTSSPSYLFLAAMDRLTFLLTEQGEELFSHYESKRNEFYEKTRTLSYLKILPVATEPNVGSAPELAAATSFTKKTDGSPLRGIYGREPSKILITCEHTRFTGADIEQSLRDTYHLEPEMTALHYVTALTSIMDTDEGWARLTDAVLEMDHNFCQKSNDHTQQLVLPSLEELYTLPPKEMEIWEALEAPSEITDLDACADYIVQDYVFLYPPGIPILVPGERMTTKTLQHLRNCQAHGFELEGLADLSARTIRTIHST